MVKISDCFYNLLILLCFVMKLAGMICKLDRFLEKFADCAVQLANWLANLTIGRLADWQIGRNICIGLEHAKMKTNINVLVDCTVKLVLEQQTA